MGRINAGVIVKTRFVDKAFSQNSNAVSTFKNYIDYIGRSEAIRNINFNKYDLASQYQSYNDYMSNPEKSSGLFTADFDTLTNEQKQNLKNVFQTAFDNDSIMWQTVVSFDNQFLAELGIYDLESETLDEAKLRYATRRMMEQALADENMSHSVAWSAAIHFNTDNIHIHIAYTEPFPTRKTKNIDGAERPKGSLQAKTIKNMKSKMVNTLLENEYSLYDQLVKKRFVPSLKSNLSPDDKILRDLWIKIYKELPKDVRQWQYKRNSMSHVRPLIDELVQRYLVTNHGKELLELQKSLLKTQSIYQTAYGRNSHYKGYSANKINEMYARMGNALLGEMREFNKYERLLARGHLNFNDLDPNQKNHLNVSIGKMKNSLQKTFAKEHGENARQYQKLQYDIDRAKQL